jgi:hypothetical protein
LSSWVVVRAAILYGRPAAPRPGGFEGFLRVEYVDPGREPSLNAQTWLKDMGTDAPLATHRGIDPTDHQLDVLLRHRPISIPRTGW